MAAKKSTATARGSSSKLVPRAKAVTSNASRTKSRTTKSAKANPLKLGSSASRSTKKKPSAPTTSAAASTSRTSRARAARADTVETTAAAPALQPSDAGPHDVGPHDAVVRELRAFGLSYPEAHTKSPWPGHLDLAVRDKTFAYLSLDGEPLRLGCKLPHSNQTALSLPFARPTPYGLGKSGWVTATFEPQDEPPTEFLKAWIDESYRAVAPKTLVKKLAGVN